MGSSCRVVACPRPFSIDRLDFSVEAGGTIADILQRYGMQQSGHARVFIDDRMIPQAEWITSMPAQGQVVTIRSIPTGGGGGGKDALRIVAMIAVVALAIYSGGAAAGALGLTEILASGQVVLTTGGFFVSAAVTGTLSIAGTLAINALIPPAPRLLTHREQELVHG